MDKRMLKPSSKDQILIKKQEQLKRQGKTNKSNLSESDLQQENIELHQEIIELRKIIQDLNDVISHISGEIDKC